ncbi:MAG TPA: class I SAM-dependent methyltransferase [Candidatus Micrarchaeota archaeon]|nr:class I SAM-dependent methyltransferase [Candidatus Micrarchaeota archaeon]
MAHVFEGDFSRLETAERKKILPAREILEEIGISRGETVMDFGCGIGYFSIPALDLVGEEGTVIAIDLSKERLAELKRRANGRKNLEIVNADNMDGIRSADVILAITVLHEIDGQREFVSKCMASLKPGGRLVVIDWAKEKTDMGPPIEHRIGKEEVISMAGKAPLEHRIDGNLYFLEFRA